MTFYLIGFFIAFLFTLPFASPSQSFIEFFVLPVSHRRYDLVGNLRIHPAVNLTVHPALVDPGDSGDLTFLPPSEVPTY
jgi:hypothetical protein